MCACSCILNKETFTFIVAQRLPLSDNISKFLFVQYTQACLYFKNKGGDISLFLHIGYQDNSCRYVKIFGKSNYFGFKGTSHLDEQILFLLDNSPGLLCLISRVMYFAGKIQTLQ